MKIIGAYMALAFGFGTVCACADTPEAFADVSSALGDLGFTQAETACTLKSLEASLGTDALIDLLPAFEDMQAGLLSDGVSMPLPEQERLSAAMGIGAFKELMVFGAGDAEAIADGLAAGTKLLADCAAEFSDDGEE